MILGIVLILLGLVGGAWTTWRHLGRTPGARAWARFAPGTNEARVLMLEPLGSVGALALGFSLVLPAHSWGWTLAGIVWLPTCFWLLIGMVFPVPRFMKPKWYREMHPKKKRAARRK